MEHNQPKIVPFLWFNNNLVEAMRFYSTVFKDMKIHTPEHVLNSGNLMTAIFEIEGQVFMGLNGGPHYTFNEAVSFFVNCNTQEEVDELWTKLMEGGTPQRCGWIKDKFGLVWQIIPEALGRLLGDPDKDKAQRVMQAMMQMIKIDVAGLQAAYDGK